MSLEADVRSLGDRMAKELMDALERACAWHLAQPQPGTLTKRDAFMIWASILRTALRTTENVLKGEIEIGGPPAGLAECTARMQELTALYRLGEQV